MISRLKYVSAQYQVGLGSAPGLSDIGALVNVSHETTEYCLTDLTLEHASTYYALVVAWNGGHVEKSNSSSSDGGKEFTVVFLWCRANMLPEHHESYHTERTCGQVLRALDYRSKGLGFDSWHQSCRSIVHIPVPALMVPGEQIQGWISMLH